MLPEDPLRSVPQHFTAFSLTRVPHVGQILVELSCFRCHSVFYLSHDIIPVYGSILITIEYDKIYSCPEIKVCIFISHFAASAVHIVILRPIPEWRNGFRSIFRLFKEVELAGAAVDEGIKIHTIFFGGGTPSKKQKNIKIITENFKDGK